MYTKGLKNSFLPMSRQASRMIDMDPLILGGYMTAIIVLLIGLIYGAYKASRGE